MDPKKVFAFVVIFSVSNLATSLPSTSSKTLAEGNSSKGLKQHCKSICSEARGSGKFDRETLVCCCEVAKITSDVTLGSMRKTAKELGINLEILKRGAIQKRETSSSPSPVSPNAGNSILAAVEDIVHQAFPNETNKHPHIENIVVEENPDKLEPKHINQTNKRSPDSSPEAATDDIVRQDPSDTSSLLQSPGDSSAIMRLEPSEKVSDKPTSSVSLTDDAVGLPAAFAENLVGESAPAKLTTRRSTPSPRRSPAPKRAVAAETARAILESAKQRISALIQRTLQPNFNSVAMAAEVDAICVSLRPLSGRGVESARHADRSALIEQIRERERERQARIQSRFGAHVDLPRKHKSVIVGAANPSKKTEKDKTSDPKTKASNEKSVGQQNPNIITQPPELIDD